MYYIRGVIKLDVYFVPIDIEDKRQCCQCGIRANLVELFSGRFYCSKCSCLQDTNTKYPFEDSNYYER